MAGDENVREVPGPMEPVLVMVRGWLAVTPRSQLEINWPATARTSLGRSAMSNAWGIEAPLLRTLRIV